MAELVKISSLIPHEQNPRTATRKAIDRLKKSISDHSGFEFLQLRPLLVNRRLAVNGWPPEENGKLVIYGGNQRFHALQLLGRNEAPCLISELTPERERIFAIKDNLITGEWDADMLGNNYDLEELEEYGFDMADIDLEDEKATGALSDEFLVPPFSVLDARNGKWQARKRFWLSKGIESEVGRGGNLLKMSDTVLAGGFKTKGTIYKGGDAWKGSGTSIFDPVLCELAYKWFAPENATILDPFAGGSVRGIVASMLGYAYAGIELRSEQIMANEDQALKILPAEPLFKPHWLEGDSRAVLERIPKDAFDLIFSCPPYHDLEQYSTDPNDISSMPWTDFLKAYREIIQKSVACLKNDRFAVFVVGEVRQKETGFYKGLVPETIRAFEDAGARLYNEAILVTAVGSLPLRIGKQFRGYRKLGKTHQNLLVFYKGNPKEIKSNFSESIQFLEELDDSDKVAGRDEGCGDLSE